MRTLVLGLGNELAADDAVGVLVARAVRERIADAADVVASSASGMALIEVFDGYDRAIVVDSIRTGRHPPGTITELGLEQIGRVAAPSLHQAGLPEMAAVAERLGLGFPSETQVLVHPGWCHEHPCRGRRRRGGTESLRSCRAVDVRTGVRVVDLAGLRN
jgi:hydrogenase maturation protease